jgi:lysine-N-methylase
MAADSPSHSDSTTVSGESRARMAQPTYAAAFRCIGASCEDTCCGNWDIPIDRSTYGKYQQFPSEKLGSLVSQFVSITTPEQPHSLYARVSMGPSGSCPFFGADHLCAIQKVHGPELLSATCSIYPRSLSRVAGELEGSLSLSCPEAARLVLLDPDFMRIKGNLFSGDFRTDNVFRPAGDPRGLLYKPHGAFLDIRASVMDLVRDRARPLWQRLLLIGSLCKRLDEISPTEGEDVIPVILRDYRRIVETQVVHGELEGMQSQPRLRLEVIFALTDARMRDASTGRRFHDVFWTFVEGIASSENSRSGDDVERFLQAEEDYHRPFFERYPFILENYLVNYIFQNLFPYGREGSADFTPRSMFDEYVQMTAQFAWVNALLIGVAGHYKGAFSEEHVVQTIQSFTRSVEHYPDVLQSITEYISSRRLDSLQGMAILLKN